MKHELPELPYEYDALEPHIDAATMETHYSKHHAGYVSKLNSALDGHLDLQAKTVEGLISGLDSLPEDIRAGVRNNGGGHANHSLFWQVMSPDGGGEPGGELAEKIKQKFGNFSDFRDSFSSSAIKLFGSGWVWLSVGDAGELFLGTTPNQDSPISQEKKPILGLDVWEHAYYLNYQNRRPDYVEAWWNVVNWKKVEENFKETN